MNDILNKYYNLDVIGIIKVTNKLYRIKTKDNKYYGFKHLDDNNESIFAFLCMLNLHSFCIPIKNNVGTYITKVNNDYFYLMNWYEEELILAKEIKLKFYIEELTKLHSLSSYDTKINKGYFEEIFIELEKMIDEEENDINVYLSLIEKKEYKSPSEWLFLMNNNIFLNSINKSKEHLNNFKKLVKDMDTIRVSLNYINFDFSNILIKEKKILGIEKMKSAPIVYDLKDLFDKSYNLSIDFIMYIKMYLKEFELMEYEKEWLLTMVYIPFIDNNKKNEIDNIMELSKIIYRINRSIDLEKILFNK